MPSAHDFNPPPHGVHPEFGYLCPSRQVRHTVRVALAAAAFGITVGAAGAFVLTPRHDPDLARPQTAATFAPSTIGQQSASAQGHAGAQAAEATAAASRVPSAPAASAPAANAAGTPATPSPANAGKAAPSAAPAARRCQDQAWPLLDSKCMTGAGRKSRNVRVVPASDPAQAAQAAPAVPVAASPTETSVAAANLPEPVATPTKKRNKTAQNRQRRRNRDIEDSDPRSAYGASRDLLPEPPRRSAWSWSW